MLENFINKAKKVTGIAAATAILGSSPLEAKISNINTEQTFNHEEVISNQIENAKMYIYNKVKELEAPLNEDFREKLLENGFTNIVIFPNEDDSSSVDIVFMDYSEDIETTDPKTGKILKGGFLVKKTIYLELDDETVKNKYELMDLMSGLISKVLKNDLEK